MRTPTEHGRLRSGDGRAHSGARSDRARSDSARSDSARSDRARSDGGSARLARLATWVLGIEAMLLVALGVSGLGGRPTPPDGLASAAAPPPVPELLGFRPSPAHSVLLLVTGLLALGALWLPAARRAFAALQAVGYLLIGGMGVLLAVATSPASHWHLYPADHLLHGVLCLLGLALLLLGRSVRPDPAGAGVRGRGSATPEPPATVDPR